ncbi:MAG TPA: DUF1835 domain-containing protein [Longimicrobium sp.]|nr:DUF1835 domain-containing protein [Longimicrobium sp.]
MLHITNGDSAVEKIRAAGVPGEVLPWRDVLHEGPVPAGVPLDDLSAIRARFLAGRGWADVAEVASGFAERDAALRSYRDHDEVVLWFEHDLYDQLQLAQLLDFFAGEETGETRVMLLVGDEYLGLSAPERLAERFGGRRAAGEAEFAEARAAWGAFAGADPRDIETVVARGTPALPWMSPALRRHLEQFPSVRHGLSRSERQALEAIAPGPVSIGDAYRASHHDREEAVWLGDLTFASYLEDLSAGHLALVTLEDGARVAAPRAGEDAAAFFGQRVVLTDAGRAVLEGREDRVRLNGIDRWLGGVHLKGREIAWRWDEEAGRIVAGG